MLGNPISKPGARMSRMPELSRFQGNGYQNAFLMILFSITSHTSMFAMESI